MLKSCKYCGRIHDTKFICPQKKQAQELRWKNRSATKALAFRRTSDWTNKSLQIRKRDNYTCLCCQAYLPGTSDNVSTAIAVHHIVPIEEDYFLRLDDENLITVCDVHHELCERGTITREQQQFLVKQSIRQYNDTDFI